MNNEFENENEQNDSMVKDVQETVGGYANALSPKLYPLDWNTTEVSLAKGRFTHTLARPSNELLLAREDELELEIPIGKDGSYSLPDSTVQEEIDAKYAEKLRVGEPEGYKGTIPLAHGAAAFQSLFQREIYVDPNCDVFGDEVTVIEEVGSGDTPDFVIKHVLRAVSEAELKIYRRNNNTGRMMPDKRGRQKLVQKSNLRSAMSLYSLLFKRIDGVKIGDSVYSDDRRQGFIGCVNALTQRAVVRTYLEELNGNLLD